MGALAVQNFVSAAVGMSVAVALIRGFARRGATTIGNFWTDLTRSTIYILLPIAFVAAIIFIGQGAVQTFGGAVHIHNTLTGFDQTLLRGPIASQEVIKQLGTNGGGFFNANGAGPFENPTGLTNLLSILLILCIPVSFTYVFGKMVFNLRQGVVILAVMAVLFGGWLAMASVAEHQGSPFARKQHPQASGHHSAWDATPRRRVGSCQRASIPLRYSHVLLAHFLQDAPADRLEICTCHSLWQLRHSHHTFLLPA